MNENLDYKMGAALLNSCNSDSGNAHALLVSDRGVFAGHDAILDPSGTGLGGVWLQFRGILKNEGKSEKKDQKRRYSWSTPLSYKKFWKDVLPPGEQGTK